MTMQPGPAETVSNAGFGAVLKNWRRRRRVSQLDLALTSNVSQRHISFLESGRSRPSREMALQLSAALDVPLRDRNDWLRAAGFAPIFKERPLDAPEMREVLAAVRMMLGGHEPYPAVAVDRSWNIRLTNAPFDAMLGLLGADIWARVGGDPNLMRLSLHPAGMRSHTSNWEEVGSYLWQRAEKEAAASGDETLLALLTELEPHRPAAARERADALLLPILPVKLEMDALRLSLFTVIATFGTAQDVTADELRIESFFPADEETRRFFESGAAKF